MARSIKFTDNTYLNSNDVKINGVGNYAEPQSLDNLYQNAKSESFLTKRGWYRIAQIFDWTNDNWQYKPQSIIVNLGTDYSHYNGSNYLISICKSGSKINATLLNDSTNYDCITELRTTRKDNKIYLEIYWNAANDDTWGNHFIYSLFSFMGGINVLDVVNGQIVNDDPEVLYDFNLSLAANASGTNENGSWHRFADGTMFCSKVIIGVPSELYLWDNNWYYVDIDGGDYAQIFTELYGCSLTTTTNQYLVCTSDASATSIGKIRLVRPNAQANLYVINVMAWGRWK